MPMAWAERGDTRPACEMMALPGRMVRAPNGEIIGEEISWEEISGEEMSGEEMSGEEIKRGANGES